jgi:hypothetical protein
MSAEDAREAGVENGDEVVLTVREARSSADGAGAGGADAAAAVTGVAVVRSAVPRGSVFLSGASVPDGPVDLSPARQPVAAG